MSILIGTGGAKSVKEIYIGVNGQPREVKEGHVGVGGTAKLFYSAAPPLPPKGKALNEYTWEEIRQIADAGKAAEYFKVGDTKAVHLKGTASKLTLDATYYVYILGFDHNLTNDSNAKNTVDFGTFKDANGKDLCLVSGYNNDSDFYMNKSSTNAGGWKSSYMRSSILGGDGSATFPEANTLMSCLPQDLRAVMKPMFVWTDNVGNKSTGSDAVTVTFDYLPLLAEYEVFGTNSYANANEPKRQAQYAYFKDGGSKVKYRSDSTGSTIDWWVRSPYRTNGESFRTVKSNGSAGSSYAEYSCGVAPIFRV